MTTWDEIKKETEKRAKKLWADDEDDDGLEPECKHEPEHSDTVYHSEYKKSYSEAVVAAVLGPTDASEEEKVKSRSDTLFSHSDAERPSNAATRTQSVFSNLSTPAYVERAATRTRSVFSKYAALENVENVPGDPIGIRSIQSIMMSATQMNLSHFHTAGMSTSLGQFRVPSAAEAMNSTYTKNNTSMKFTMHKQQHSHSHSDKYAGTLPNAGTRTQSVFSKAAYLENVESENLSETFEQLRYLRKKLVGASLGNFVRRIGSNLTGLNDRENIWYSTLSGESLFPNGSISTEDPRVLLRFYIDFNKMHNHGLTLENLAQEVFGSDCQWNVSPDFMGMIDILVPPDTYISQWLSRTKNRVCGTSYVVSCDSLGKQHKVSYFFTRGTNVLAACKVHGVDKSTLTLNNVISVEKNFGIEAAANILTELTGNDSDTRVRVISDFMARTGTVLPFSKHSNEVSSKGLLTSMGFERPKDDIQKEITGKVIKSKSMHIKSVYEHIITGKDAPSSFKILT